MASAIHLWHDFRLPILGLVLCFVAAVQLFLYLRYRSQRASARSPAPIAIASKSLETSKPAASVPLQTTSSPSPRLTYRTLPRRIVGSKLAKQTPLSHDESHPIQPIVFFSSLSGATEKAAEAFAQSLAAFLSLPRQSDQCQILKPSLLDLSYIDYDDYFTSPPKQPKTKHFYIILVPTYNIDTILNTFLAHLDETHHDFRVDTGPLAPLLGYAVFGFGDKDAWPTEEQGFCSQANETDKWMAKLTGGKRAYPLGMGDVKTDALERLEDWRFGVQGIITDFAAGKTLGDGVPGSGDPLESDVEEEEEGDEGEEEGKDEVPRTPGKRRRRSPKTSLGIDDLESLGGTLKKPKGGTSGSLPIDFTTYRQDAAPLKPQLKEMVPQSSPTYTALTKQGYTIVGSHSGVKICRWTKSALRGRGSCYKFSFYGIKSHLCMETTPSLSCSNKCVFCWRHGTNPVGTTWRWQVDPPDLIFEGVKKGHYSKIKMMRGVPGVRAERFEEAMKIRHCALSLVGEPIFYPHINEFTALLHNERISSFLVCNAQHPDQLAALRPVTQLYVSIDASNRESLRKIDRPLHRDFWERFCRCLDILREKRFRQRTVFRLTLVKGFNIEDEAEGYADLVARGLPCFVEVKGVTYCGTSSSAGAGLTMKNVPFYEEVCTFVTALNEALERRGLDYGIAAEHAHSCCVLLASRRFFKNGKWRSVIDYTRFFELLESGQEFAPEQYTAETPEWALWGNGGFDPADERVYRKGKKAVEAA